MPDIKIPSMGRRGALYKEDHKSFGEWILSQGMRKTVSEVALGVAMLAAKTTPRSKGSGPHMADQYRVNPEGGVMKVDRALRVVVRVENDSDHAAAVEFGGRFNKRRRMLGRAAAVFGDFKGDPQ